MGIYVNPADCSKEEWLGTYGTLITRPAEFDSSDSESLVCLVNNGPFTAAGVVYDEAEFVAFTQVDDPRPRLWYSVPTSALQEVMSAADYRRLVNQSS